MVDEGRAWGLRDFEPRSLRTKVPKSSPPRPRISLLRPSGSPCRGPAQGHPEAGSEEGRESQGTDGLGGSGPGHGSAEPRTCVDDGRLAA